MMDDAFSFDPDGDIALDWQSANGFVSFSIRADGRLCWAVTPCANGPSHSGTAMLVPQVFDVLRPIAASTPKEPA
jgi:hypothetical protein